MKEDRSGLTTEEREHLTAQPESQEEMDLKMSLLAFVSLLLICVLIVAASLIAGHRGKSDESSIKTLRFHGSAETLPP